MPRVNPLRALADRQDALRHYSYCARWLNLEYISRQLGMPEMLTNIYGHRHRYKTISVGTVLVMQTLRRAVRQLERKVVWMRKHITEKSKRRPIVRSPRP